MKGKTLSKRVIVLATTATMLSSTVAFAQDICKDETVYVIMKDNGKVEQRIVSTWIKGEENLGEFKDKCNLKDVKNVKGEETPTANGDTLTWNIEGKDLYYRGESERELPISVDIKYELNGKSVDPAEVKGQSGNFKITMKVKNNESKVMKIAGEDRRVYVPFVVASEIIMPNDNFKDVKINNGKMITDGNNANITFVAVPGLMESLKIDSIVDLDVKDEIVIEGKTEDFAVPSMVVMATTEGLDLKDMDANDDLDDLRSQLDQLKQGGEDLLSGAQELNNGEKELQSKYNEFNAGVGTLRNGVDTYLGNYGKINAGVNTLSDSVNKYVGAYGQIEGGISQVTAGVSQVAAGAPQLRDGSTQVTAGLKELLENQTKFTNEGVNALRDGLDAYVKAHGDINNGIDQSLEGVKKIKGGLEAKAPEMQKLAGTVTTIEGVQKQVDELKGKFAPESEEGKKLDAISQTLGAVAAGQKSGFGELQTGTQEAVKGLGDLEAGLGKASAGSKLYTQKGEGIVESANKLSGKSVALGKGIGDLYSGSATLTGKLNELAGKSKELEAGAKKVSEGSKVYSEKGKELSNGAGSLLVGANALNDGGAILRTGSENLYSGSNQVMAGINKLSDGSSKLYEGVAKLKADGLDKINEKGNTVLGDIDGFMEVKDELVKLSDEYGTFSGLTDGMEGKVKFVMRINDENKPSTTESAKKAKEEENKKSVKVEEKKEEKGTGLFKSILSIFKK